MSDQLQVGDVVSLAGQRHSPEMTVISVFTNLDEIEMARVAWFDGQRRNKAESYPCSVLTRVNADA